MGILLHKVEDFSTLAEPGFDIEQCFLDCTRISIRCEDIRRYKKAFRVRIRGLIKTNNRVALSACIDNFYRFATFIEYLYGHHSCATGVSSWQEETARFMQKKYRDIPMHFSRGEQIVYAPRSAYEKHFREQYALLSAEKENSAFECMQDNKPFLTLKDYAHFERWS